MEAVEALTATLDHDPDGTPVVVLAGQLDLATAAIAQRAVALATGEGTLGANGGQAADVVFDMTDLTFMDSTGLTVLLTAVHRGHAVRLRRPTSLVRRVIGITGLESTLPVEP